MDKKLREGMGGAHGVQTIYKDGVARVPSRREFSQSSNCQEHWVPTTDNVVEVIVVHVGEIHW